MWETFRRWGHSLIKHKQISYSVELHSLILYIVFFFFFNEGHIKAENT